MEDASLLPRPEGPAPGLRGSAPEPPGAALGAAASPESRRPLRLRRESVALWLGCAAGVLLAFAVLLPFLGCANPASSGSPAKRVFTPVASASSSEVLDFLARAGGGNRAKLVYVDRTRPAGELCFLDFAASVGAPAVQVIAAAKDPAVPVISPDGEWVTYASGSGAEAGSPLSARSSVWLVRLAADAKPVLVASDSACEPRFVQDPAGGLAIVYTTLAPNVAWEGFGKTLKVAVDVSGAAPVVGEPEVLVPDGSYTGGLSFDARYLAGGGGHVALLDRQGGKVRPDTLSYGLIQSCNASVSASRVTPGAVMYLNTNGSHPAIGGGRPWGEWQAILISDAAKRLLRGYLHPAEFAHPLETDPPSLTSARWHHNEWSNHPHFAAATLNADRYFRSGSGYVNTAYQERVYLINLRDSAYLEILRPDRIAFGGKDVDVSGLYWPWLWVEVPAGFKEEPGWLAPL